MTAPIPSAAPSPLRRVRARRRAFRLLALVFLISTTATGALATLLASRLALRWDVTALHEHALSDRTRSILAAIEGAHEIVIATEWSALSPHVRDRVSEAVRRLEDASPRVRATFIDTAAPEGQDRYRRLIDRLVERDRAALEEHRELIGEVLDELGSLDAFFAEPARALEELSRLLARGDARSRGAAPTFAGFASAARAAPEQAREVIGLVEADLERARTPEGLPALDDARIRLVSVMESLRRQFAELADQVERVAGWPGAPEGARSLASELRRVASARAARAAARADALRRLERPDALRIAGHLSQRGAALVIGPPAAGVTAIDLGALFPPAALGGGEGAVVLADLPRRSEELVTTALAALAAPDRPVVILVHAHPRRFIDEVIVLEGVLDRLRLRGIDLAEWRVTRDDGEPDLSDIDPAGARPRVYFVIGNDTVVGGQEGIDRAAALGGAIERLIDRGENLLVAAIPSALPAFGMPDPVTAPLKALALDVRSGEVVLERDRSGDGPGARTEHRITPGSGDHPIARTIAGLATVLSWPVPIRPELPERAPGERIEMWPLIELERSRVRVVSEWASLWQARGQGASALSGTPPTDDAQDPSGRVVVAAAAERSAPGLLHAQRAVVVGGYDWFFDRWTQEAEVVDGVPRYRNPGNAELFEAAVWWLAGRDEMVAASPTARPVAVISPMEATRLSLLRWSVALGPPGLVLLLGAAWRLLRG